MSDEEIQQARAEQIHLLMIRLISLMDAEAADVDDLAYPAAFARLRELFYVEQLRMEGVVTNSAVGERDMELLREIRRTYERLLVRADSGVRDQLMLTGRSMLAEFDGVIARIS
jgi:hypothetical protein